MVSSSRPSLSQSSRELAPVFSKGKTRKIPWLVGTRVPCARVFVPTSEASKKAVQGTIRFIVTKNCSRPRQIHPPDVAKIFALGKAWNRRSVSSILRLGRKHFLHLRQFQHRGKCRVRLHVFHGLVAFILCFTQINQATFEVPCLSKRFRKQEIEFGAVFHRTVLNRGT